MIILSESSPQLPDSASLRDLIRSTEAARLAGWQVYHIPGDLPPGVSADDALWHVPVQPEIVVGLWTGYIPLPEHYEEIYQAAFARNIHLVNAPDQFRRAEEFDQFYPFIEDLTARSECVADVSHCEAAAQRIGYPVFLKGTVQSLKSDGIGSCVAHTPEELKVIAGKIMSGHRRSLGKVIVRELLDLRCSRVGPGEFPLGREYRVFVYDREIVGLGYYWEGEDDLAELQPDERKLVEHLALEAASRLGVPYIAVDIGQKQNGDWIVIEVGDAQFSGFSQIPIQELWARLTARIEAKSNP
jgi:hypothetical protein